MKKETFKTTTRAVTKTAAAIASTAITVEQNEDLLQQRLLPLRSLTLSSATCHVDDVHNSQVQKHQKQQHYQRNHQHKLHEKPQVTKLSGHTTLQQLPRRQLKAVAIVMCLYMFSGLVSLANGLANCPNSCQCDDDILVVKCGEGTLDVLPIALNPSIQRLIIKNNKIKTIDSPIQFYAELTFLDLSYNDLVTIHQRTFAYQRKLQELHLNHNKIGQITSKTFIGLSALSVLNLRGNLLAELEDTTFSPLGKLEELNLGQNRISRISAKALEGLINLKVLYLDDNTLTSVPASECFRSIPNLAELYLGTNSFMTIPAEAFSELKGLTRLDLKGAGLHNISAEAMRGLEGVRYLDLSDNRLQHIPQAALARLERLEDLSLGQNDFSVISSGAFLGLKNLKRLEITGAQRLRRVENSAFTTNSNLEYLNLSTNKMLSEIQENAFTGLPHLKHIILKGNQLPTLAEGFFSWSDLHTLDLSDNPLICDCQLLWLRSLLFAKNGTNEQILGVVCSAPASLKGEPLNAVTSSMLGCSHADAKQQFFLGILLVVSAAAITILALVIYTCRRKIRELLKGDWGNPALGRKEREYQKTFSDEDYMTRQPQMPCPLTANVPYATSSSGYGQQALQYMGSRPIPVANGCGPVPDNQSPFMQLEQIQVMSNNSHCFTAASSSYFSQQDMRKSLQGKSHTMSSLPRHAGNRNHHQQQESSLTHNHVYTQPLNPCSGLIANSHYSSCKANTTERHVRLTQDHFNHNNTTLHHKYNNNKQGSGGGGGGAGAGGGGGGGALSINHTHTLDANYLHHNDSHYSLPVDHNLSNCYTSPPSTPTPTPPPPALPMRNGICSTTGRHTSSSSNNNNNNNSNNTNNMATLIRDNNSNSLRHQYH
uniref:LRRCT domain-containing protein n=1 Tax=Glossina pallidipes TaxID=7398 RepID=A0A1B0AIA0_GLOPL